MRCASSGSVVVVERPADLELADHGIEPLLADGDRARPDHGT